MAVDIVMPALSPSMTHAKLVRWLIDVGDNVSQGDIVAEVESDKAAMEIYALDDGVVQALHVLPSEDDVAVNTPLATILEGEDDRSSQSADKNSESHGSVSASTSRYYGGSLFSDNHEPVMLSEQHIRVPNRVFISPIARKLAYEGHYDVREITGTGPNGRIVRRDVERHVPKRCRSSQLSACAATHDYYRMHSAVDVGKLEGVINELNDSGELAITLEFHGFLLRAVALAVERTVGFPRAVVGNGSSEMNDKEGCAIHTLLAENGGTREFVVENVSRQSVAELCHFADDESRSAMVSPDSFMADIKVMDFSYYGIEFFEGVIDPAFVALLSVAAPVDRPAMVEGALVPRRTMTFALACAQRSISELVAARFLRNIKQLLESPWALIL